MSNGTAINLPATRVRRRAASWLALALVGGTIAAGAVLVIDGDSDRSSSPASGAAPVGDVLRYDGGPEEGSRGPTSSHAAGTVRYDGGPEEGSRGSR